MATTLLTVTHLVCCALLLIFSFICITPLADVMRNFKGHCFIGANITIVKHPSYNVIADDLTGEASHCVFPEFMGFMVLIFSVVYLVWNSCLAFKSRESTWLDSFVGTVLSCVMTICMLISAAVISAGINKLCDRLGRGTFRCESVDYEPSNWLAWRDKDGVITYPEDLKTDGFYTKFQIAQAFTCLWVASCASVNASIFLSANRFLFFVIVPDFLIYADLTEL